MNDMNDITWPVWVWTNPIIIIKAIIWAWAIVTPLWMMGDILMPALLYLLFHQNCEILARSGWKGTAICVVGGCFGAIWTFLGLSL